MYLETVDAVVLIDPLVPEEPDEERRFWDALDRDVARAGVPVHVLLTIHWHVRSTPAIVDRYGATVHVQSGARAAIERRLRAPGAHYRPPADLPGGVVALQGPVRSEVMFWIPAHRTLVTGDVLHGDGKRALRSPWLNDAQHGRMKTIAADLAELRVERILSSHGEPLLRHGRAALRAVASA